MSYDTDREIVLGCLVGEEAAFEVLLGRYQVRVFSFVARLAGNESDAEDLCQEIFLKAFVNLEAYDQDRPLISWLLGIAHNCVVDFLRSRKPGVSLDDEEAPFDPPDSGQAVEEAVQSALDQQTFEGLIAELPERYREAMLLRHLEELDYAAMADVLGLPQGTVKIRLFRAREMMRKRLQALGYGP
ncbi:MAG: sigma-70 family RNA polymerase sigma factor [Elusimicrobia bacterium]|nr:sigma-70 family RNA polymerase sigma factor [Elusimicrobiota bacterium]